ncbi:nuclear transport factor 2 family protein [Nocardia brasiliensis]|uniref:nuclear transport factor 2 family protein n=1 Tax=Nocardia brasiliensis TaxID=37326 RepID=UPI00189389AF|nr:nuclear transport factor 2 family protein [Nocardia brasiliensis]MBF6542384.1 nuclear transport factor 2 family protein [Nocardia brasiliensis]
MTTMTDQNRSDTATVDAILFALYDVISGPAGERDFDRMRALFLPGARLIPAEPLTEHHVGGRALDCDAFIEQIAPLLRTQPFYEVEIARRTERFGPIVHALSTYESRLTPDGAPFIRGINSIQLLHRDGRWWVVTIFWSNEAPGQPIPERYLINAD